MLQHSWKKSDVQLVPVLTAIAASSTPPLNNCSDSQVPVVLARQGLPCVAQLSLKLSGSNSAKSTKWQRCILDLDSEPPGNQMGKDIWYIARDPKLVLRNVLQWHLQSFYGQIWASHKKLIYHLGLQTLSLLWGCNFHLGIKESKNGPVCSFGQSLE